MPPRFTEGLPAALGPVTHTGQEQGDGHDSLRSPVCMSFTNRLEEVT
jgi:hypothetical protein